MAEDLDDETPEPEFGEQEVTRTTSYGPGGPHAPKTSAPRGVAGLVERAAKPERAAEPAPVPITAPADAGLELAVLSAILGDPDGLMWAKAKHLAPETLGSAGPVWRVLQDGVPAADLFTLSKRTGLSIRQLLEIGEVDRAGATFSAGLRALTERQRLSTIARLGRELAEQPHRAAEIWAQVQATADAPDALPALPATALRLTPRTDRSCLLGNRFLNRGDGMILAGSSGMGKSSMMLQAAVLWALARPFFGIKPNGAIKSLIIQSEDSEGDVAEVWESIAHELKLTAAERATVGENVEIVTDRIHRGESFIREAGAQIRRSKPDLVWVNPLAAFVGGDISDAQDAGVFLREQLNGLNKDCQFGWAIVTHTTKPPTDKGKTERKWSEVMYDMAGSYDLIGWARAIMSLRATENPGDFDLVLAKRGGRADVMVESTSDSGIAKWVRTTVIPVRHATGTFTHPDLPGEIPLVVWEARELPKVQQGSNGRPKKNGIEQYIVIIPPTPDKALGMRQMHRLAIEISPVSIGGFFNLVNAAVDGGIITRDLTNPRLPRFYLNSNPK